VIRLIDIRLVQQYVNAIKSRDAINQLPTGLREHAKDFEPIALADICAQAGENLTEQEVLALIPALPEIPNKTIQSLLSVAVNFIMAALKKYYPTLTWSAVSGLIGHFIK